MVTPVWHGNDTAGVGWRADEWVSGQGVSWEKNFLSLIICQGLAHDLFTYLISG